MFSSLRCSPLLIVPFLIAAGPPANARLHYVLDETHSDIRADVAFLGLANETAHFPSASGHIELDPTNIESIKLDVTLDARELTAHDDLTLSRLKGPKFFDVAHYPQLRFFGEHFVMTGEKTAKLSGEITARGLTRAATLDVTFSEPIARANPNHAIMLRATTAINRDDFGMTAYHFIVGRNVTITIDATMAPA